MSTSAKRICLGLDIGGTEIKAVLYSESGSVLQESALASNAQLGPNAVRESVRNIFNHFRNRSSEIAGIGIGCAGSVDSQRGMVRNSPNFAQWKDVPLVTWVREDSGLPVFVDNDANCAALAEWHSGNGKGVKNLVLLTLGTGVGGGLILNNQLYRGSTGTGAELGHFSIRSNGIECPCGNRGCFERYCSASALKQLEPRYSAKEIFERVNSDPRCKSLVEEFIQNLEVGMTSLANVFDPDMILLGGAVSKGLIPYFEEIKSWVCSHSFPAVGKHIQIGFTKFDNLSGAIGAALLPLESQTN